MDALQLYNFKPTKKTVYTLPQKKQKVLPKTETIQEKLPYVCYKCFGLVKLSSADCISCQSCGTRIVYKPNQNKSLIYNAI